MSPVWRWLTSYPMRPVQQLFIDRVNKKPVSLYADRHGRLWMAQSRWQIQRVAWQSTNENGPRG